MTGRRATGHTPHFMRLRWIRDLGVPPIEATCLGIRASQGRCDPSASGLALGAELMVRAWACRGGSRPLIGQSCAHNSPRGQIESLVGAEGPNPRALYSLFIIKPSTITRIVLRYCQNPFFWPAQCLMSQVMARNIFPPLRALLRLLASNALRPNHLRYLIKTTRQLIFTSN